MIVDGLQKMELYRWCCAEGVVHDEGVGVLMHSGGDVR